jgi:ferritin
MALSDQCQKDLNTLMNHIRMVANNLASIKCAAAKDQSHGLAAMLKHETMERWAFTGEIAKYLTCHGATVHREALPKSTLITGGLADLQVVLPMDKQTVDVIKSMINSAMQRGSHTTAIFLTDLMYCCKKEYHEIKDIVDELAAIANDPGAVILYDKWLLDEYENSYHNNNDYNYC